MTVLMTQGSIDLRKKKRECLGWQSIKKNCQILQCGTLNNKIKGWIDCLWFKIVVFWNVTLQFKIQYITSEALEFSRNKEADVTWKFLFGMIVDMFVKGDNRETDNCRQNIKKCKYRDYRTKKKKKRGMVETGWKQKQYSVAQCLRGKKS